MSHVSYKILGAAPCETHTAEFYIDDILMLLHSNVREIRATPVNMTPPPAVSGSGDQINDDYEDDYYYTASRCNEVRTIRAAPVNITPPAVPRPHLKLQFQGHEKDIVELSYFSPSTYNYVKGDVAVNIYNDKTRGQDKKVINTIFLNSLEAGKWTYLATLLKRDLTDAATDFLLHGILKLTIILKVMKNANIKPADKILCSDINKFLNMKPSANAVFIIKSKDGQEYNVHKAVLASQSAVLKAHFDNGTTESQSNVVEAPFEAAVLEEVLSYMYSDKIPRMKELAKDILAAADYYQLDGLKTLCEEELGEQLTADNANEMFELANSFQAVMLKRWSSELTKKLQFCQQLNAEWKLEYYIGKEN